MSRSQLLASLLLLLLSAHRFQVASLPLPPPIEDQVRQPAPRSTASCVLNGNSDLYGLGIRLGVYFQLVSTLLANHFLPSALREAWDANSIFLISIFVAVLKSSVNVNNLTAPEAFVMLQMLFAFLIAVYHIGQSSKWLLFEVCTFLLQGTAQPGLSWVEMVSELGQAQGDVSQLGTTMRQFLALAIASYNVWFWFAGNEFLDIDRRCNSFMFVFAQVDLHGNAKIFFQVLAVAYLLYQWYRLAFLGPAFHIFEIWFWKWEKKRGDEPAEPKPTWTGYFLGLFDPISVIEKEKVKTLAKDKNQKIRRSRKHDRRLKMGRALPLLWHTITFASSLFFIIWSVLAIELTLAWNDTQGIYIISSTGQIIPFIVGLAGLLKTLFSLFLIVWKKSVKDKQKLEPEVQKNSATWKYRLSKERCAVFSAKPPDRRWSFDTVPLENPAVLQKPKESRTDRLAPAYPILKEDEFIRRCDILGIDVYEPDWESGRWLYTTKAQNLHIFHNYTISARNSLNDLPSLQKSNGPKPHPGRDQTLIPLSRKKDHEENESKRTHWYWSERLKLGKAWGNQNMRHTSRRRPSPGPGALVGDPDQERCFWLPDDVDAGSFESVSIAAPDADMDSPRFRRWSFDEKDIAYPDHGSPTRRYPFLSGRDWEAHPARAQRAQRFQRAHRLAEFEDYVPRTDSRSTSPDSSRSSVSHAPRDRSRSSRSPGPRHSRPSSTLGTRFDERTPTPSPSISPSHRSHRSAKPDNWLTRFIVIAKKVAFVFNTLFLCAPFTALSRKIRLDHATRSRSKQFPRRASHIRKYPSTQPVKFRYSAGSSHRRTRCRECDRDFNIHDRRRRWLELTAERPRNRSPESMEAKYVFTPKYTVDVLYRWIRPWMGSKEFWKKVRAFGRYEIMAGLNGEGEDDDEEKRGRQRSGADGERRGVQERGKKEHRRR